MAKDIVIKCQKCGHRLRTTAQFIGKKGHCPKCNAVIRVQDGEQGRADGTEQQIVSVSEVETPKDSLLRIQKQNDVAVVSFVTSRILDQSNVQQLGDEFDGLVDSHQLRKIVLNFANVSYMSSAVMGKLVSLLKKVQGAGGQLSLCAIEDSIYEIFKIMRFDKMFKIYKQEDEAVIAMMA
jgi:anti-sigma B factor antagonist